MASGIDLLNAFKANNAECEIRKDIMEAASAYIDDDLTGRETAEQLFGEAIKYMMDGWATMIIGSVEHEYAEKLANAIYRLFIGYAKFEDMREGHDPAPTLDWSVTAEDDDRQPQSEDEFSSVDFDGFEDGKATITHGAGMSFRSHDIAQKALEACQRDFPQYDWHIESDVINHMNHLMNDMAIRKHFAASAKKEEV